MSQGYVRRRKSRDGRPLTWDFTVELGGTPRRRKTVGGFRTQAEAAKALRDALGRIDRGDDAFPVRTTVAEFVDNAWLPHLERQGRIRPSAIVTYRQQMRDYVLPAIGHLAIAAVRPAHVQAVLDSLTDRRSPRTVAYVRTTMSAAFQHALRLQLVTVNPVRATQAPAKRPAKLRTPTGADLRALIGATKDTEFEIAILLSATTGIRRSEVLGLRWNNVDLDASCVHIVEGLHRVAGELVYLAPKTVKSARAVPLLPGVVTRLRQHRLEQAQRLLVLGVRSDVVCDRGDGLPIDPSTYTHAVARVTKQIGLDGVRLHDLRHAVATLLASSGNAPELTSAWLGHASVGFTLSTYVHATDDRLAGSAALLGGVLDA